MPLPVAHAILGASVVVVSRPKLSISQDWKAILLGGVLAISPDFDIFFLWAFNLDGSWHRSLSHSLLFALVAGLCVAALTGKARLLEIAAFTSATASHGLVDILVTKTARGVRLFWPLFYRFKLGMFDYFAPHLDPRHLTAVKFLTRFLEI